MPRSTVARSDRQPAALRSLLEEAFTARQEWLKDAEDGAVRLFNGFLEGCPGLVAELYAGTLVLLNHAKPAEGLQACIQAAQAYYLERLSGIECVVVKTRHGGADCAAEAARKGQITYGGPPARQVREHGVWYSLDLIRTQDTGFYLDTRNLRRWAIQHLCGKRVLNTFAYTGSLGVAAQAAGASRVVQLDRNPDYLEQARQSSILNGFPSQPADFRAQDFFPEVSAMKKAGERFDCVFLDPPFFSVTTRGRVDQVGESGRLINKVRPLIANDGWLAAVNNALFLSGAAYIKILESLCADGYLMIEDLIAVPEDCAGLTPRSSLPADPAPFNHATKIALLKVRRKA